MLAGMREKGSGPMARKVTLEDVVQYTAVSDVYANAEGTTVLYQTHTPILAENRYEDQEWLRTAAGTEAFPLIEGAPFWTAPDVFYYAVNTGRYDTGIYRYAQGTQTEIVRVPFKARVIAVLADGRIVLQARINIALKRRAAGKSGAALQALRDEIAQAEVDCMTIDEFPYWSDGQGLTNKIRHALYLYDAAQGLRQLTPDLFQTMDTAWDAQQETLYVLGSAYAVQRPGGGELYRIDLRTLPDQTEDGEALQSVPAEGYRTSEIAWDSENHRLVFAGSHVGGPRGTDLYSLTPQTGEVQRLASLELSYGASILTDVLLGNGGGLQVRGGRPYFAGTWREEVRVYTVDEQGNVSAVVDQDGPVVVHGYAVTAGGIYYSALSGLDHTELFLRTWAGGTERLTDYNEAHWSGLSLSVPERLSYTDAYGFEIVGYVLRPRTERAGQRYPAILDIHGGPSDAYGLVFSHQMQYLAAHGYYVFWCNPTGSTGGGRAFSEIRGGTGGSDYEDIMGFTDLVLASYPAIDPARVGVTGGSYGGFMTNWIIGHTGRFAAAASCRSTANNITEAANKDIAPYFMRSMTTPDDPERIDKLWALSPLKYIDKSVTTTPTLFLHSMEDYRCYHVESLQMYAALQYIGIPTRMILFKNESHGLSRNGHPRNRIRRLREITAWMDRYLRPDAEHVHTEDEA